MTADELMEKVTQRSFSDLYRYIYEKEAAAQGKLCLFVKENHAWQFQSCTMEHFPDARYVLLVRDPRDMAVCCRDSGFPRGIIGAADVWKEDQHQSMMIYSWLKDTGRMHVVRFEELLLKSEKAVSGICGFLQISYDPKMLRFYEDPNVQKNAQSNFAWTDLARPIQKDNCGFYTEKLAEQEIKYVETVCRTQMQFLGYKLDFPDERLAPDACRSQLPPQPDVPSSSERFSDEQTDMRERWRNIQKKIRSRTLFQEETCV